mmetsp:Transcript_14192/g.33016  ORF Transcript_14192/g.33016 Transcript_14192/m.33016 type:complete len:106 (+) Transcript_14192:282-599(+)
MMRTTTVEKPDERTARYSYRGVWPNWSWDRALETSPEREWPPSASRAQPTMSDDDDKCPRMALLRRLELERRQVEERRYREGFIQSTSIIETNLSSKKNSSENNL